MWLVSVYLIDGYNLLHQILDRPAEGRRRTGTGRARDQRRAEGGSEEGGPERYGPAVDLEEERGRLLDRIASFMGGTSDRAMVVFDSRAQALQKSESATAQVEVYFGSFSRSADSIIEREAYALSAGESVIVVSSDYQLQKTVFRPDVIRRSSRQFASELQEHTKKIANRQNCITMSHRIEERIPSDTLEKLARLREEVEEDPRGT